MSINKLLLAGVAGTFLAGSATMAAEPVKLTDAQMDDVTAGFLRLNIGLRLANLETAAGGRTFVSQDVGFNNVSVDAQTLDVVEKETCGTIKATSILSSTTTAGSSTVVDLRGGGQGSLLSISSLKVGGTFALEALPPF